MNSKNDYRPSSYSFPSLPSILEAERKLTPILGDHVYVGGACVGFYVDDFAAAEIRSTMDVDVIVQIATQIERIQLDEKLRHAGLKHDMDGPICRWLLGDLKIDIMPVDSSILGFSNRWYPDVMSTSITLSQEELTLRIPNVCAFIATKMEAYADRGNNDPTISTDFEDIIRVLDGCSFLLTEAHYATEKVKNFVSSTLAEWHGTRWLAEALTAHLLDDNEGSRAAIVNQRIQGLISLSS